MKTSSELKFLVERCPGAFGGHLRPSTIPITLLDLALLLRLARFHRVQGLLWSSLRSVDAIPQSAREELSADFMTIASTNLRSAAECARLSAAFENRGIDVLFVKGLTVGMLAYGTIATKVGVDIDLLVHPNELEGAAVLLRENGYRLTEPASTSHAQGLAIWHRHRKESTWVDADGTAQVDLHTRLSDNPRLIPSIGLGSARQAVEVSPGISLPTLADDELFAYLAVHGASSAWFRLKWIIDFAALIHGKAASELERLHERSQQLGAGRAPAQALLLADALFGSLAGAEALKTRLMSDRGARWLAKIALRQIGGGPVEPTSRRLGTAAIHYSQLLLVPGSAFKLSEAVRQVRASLA